MCQWCDSAPPAFEHTRLQNKVWWCAFSLRESGAWRQPESMMRFHILDNFFFLPRLQEPSTMASPRYVSVYFISLIIVFHEGHGDKYRMDYCISRTDTPLLLFSSATPYVKMLVETLVNENSLIYLLNILHPSHHLQAALLLIKPTDKAESQSRSLTLRWSSLKAEEDPNSTYDNWNEFFNGVKLCFFFLKFVFFFFFFLLQQRILFLWWMITSKEQQGGNTWPHNPEAWHR